MKTALIAGVSLLALTLANTDAFIKKQNLPPECQNPTGDLRECKEAAENLDKSVACTGRCKSALTDYINDCLGGAGLDEFNQEYDKECSAAATVVTLFTVVSAFLVAVGN